MVTGRYDRYCQGRSVVRWSWSSWNVWHSGTNEWKDKTSQMPGGHSSQQWYEDRRSTGKDRFERTRHKMKIIQQNTKSYITRMWANAQRNGRPAKHRWRPITPAIYRNTQNTYIRNNESKHSEMGPVRQNQIQRTVRSIYVCALHCAQLLHTIVPTAQNRPNNFRCYTPDNHNLLRWCLFEGRGNCGDVFALLKSRHDLTLDDPQTKVVILSYRYWKWKGLPLYQTFGRQIVWTKVDRYLNLPDVWPWPY